MVGTVTQAEMKWFANFRERERACSVEMSVNQC